MLTRRGQKILDGFKFGTFIDLFLSDSAASMAVKGLITFLKLSERLEYGCITLTVHWQRTFKSFYRLTTTIPQLSDQRKTSGAMKHSLLSSEGALQAGLANAVLAHQHEACAKHGLRPIGAGLVICPHCLQTACQNLPRGIIWKHHPRSSSVIFKTFLVVVCTHLIVINKVSPYSLSFFPSLQTKTADHTIYKHAHQIKAQL